VARPELRFVPLLGALFVVLVVLGYLVAGDTPDHHALGSESGTTTTTRQSTRSPPSLSRSGPSLCCSSLGTSAPY
jgi:hypothetical protein